MQKKPELLLPVGNVESFYAALQGGADAIYLGLKQFNARGWARNFTNSQLQSILKEAKGKNVKVYITLNTVIKNSEISELLEYLNFLNSGDSFIHNNTLQNLFSEELTSASPDFIYGEKINILENGEQDYFYAKHFNILMFSVTK